MLSTMNLCLRRGAPRAFRGTFGTSIRGQRPLIPKTALPSSVSINVSRRYYAAGPTVVVVPPIADSISEGTIKQWSAAEGTFVKTDDVICVLETDKVNIDVKAPHDGVVTKHLFQSGEDVRVGQELFQMVAGDAPKDAPKAAPKTEAAKPASSPKAEPVKETPKAAPVKETPKAAPATPAAPTTPAAPVTTGGSRNDNRVKMSKMRARIAERLKDSQNTAAMLTTFNEIDMTNLMELRNKYGPVFEKKHGTKLGFMSAFAKASATALLQFPEVNASIDGKDIIYHDYVDISVAVATPTGLVVPVLRNVEKMSFADIEKAIAALGVKAREGKIAIEDMAGGTFTISNGGVYGSLMGTPIINPPQSAILGMHAINQRATVVGNEIKARPIMFVALTYDHRIIDGRDAVSFLKKIKTIVEEPTVLLLDL